MASKEQERYIINTFITERDAYYEKAAEYYQQKAESLINSLKNKAEGKLKSDISNIKDVETLFSSAINNFNSLANVWDKLYNLKLSQEDIQRAIIKYNENAKKIDNTINNKLDTMIFLEALLENRVDSSIINELKEVNLPQTLDMTSVQRIYDRLEKADYTNPSAAGGARARLFGEVFEQLVLGHMKNNLADIFEFIEQMGTAKSLNYSGRITSGKSDIMLGVDNVEIVTEQVQLRNGKTGTVTALKSSNIPNTIDIDLVEAVDLQNNSVDSILSQYSSGEKSKIIGATVKQWTQEGHGATLAHSNDTARKINDRWPNGQISEGFKDQETFKSYTAYVLSRFMINVIGAYNILMVSGSKMELTHTYLRQLKSKKLSIVHMIKMTNGLYKAKNDVYIAHTL